MSDRMTQMTTRQQVLGLVGWVLVTFVAAAIGSAASIEAGPFYTALVRPGWAPPAWLFGPVWTALYALMAIAAWLVWRVGGFRQARTALTLFLVQLALNALWSWLFFGWRQGGAAFAEILVLLAAIVATVVAFWRIRPLAGALLLPYLAWVGFATVLNWSVWQLNPQLL
jgi:tryptophan-rich sensory protein